MIKRDDISQYTMNPHRWSFLMKGFVPSRKNDKISTGTFDTGGPSLDNLRWYGRTKDDRTSSHFSSTRISSVSDNKQCTDA